MKNTENQETSKVIQDTTNVDTQKIVEDNFDAKQKGESLEKPCSDEEPVETKVKENLPSEETNGVDVANVFGKVDDGAEKMSESNKEYHSFQLEIFLQTFCTKISS